MGDVLTGEPAGVERAHGQLRTGLTDGLRGDDAGGLADVDHTAMGQRPAVAFAADAHACFAREDRPHPHLLHAAGADGVGVMAADLEAGREQHLLLLVEHVLGQSAGIHPEVALLLLVLDGDEDAALGPAVLLTDDDLL